ncbi:unnamed protein product [Sphagnum troendelagicum]|uniref:HVA22-like protein n=1 Tax=Sphagnum troendelagicum TaxID=128251 RepID=A0ABP0U9E1_9BRYO
MAALLSSALGGEVGLRLLLSPASSHVIVRTACTVVGIGFPVYSTHKAIVRKNPAEQEQWLVYWAVYGCFSVAEFFSDQLLSWCPFYYHVKFVFLVWLQLPSSSGSQQLYSSLLRPLLLKHHARLDRVVDGTRNEMSKFIVNHQQEIQAVKGVVLKLASTLYQAGQDVMQITHSNGVSSVRSTGNEDSAPAADDQAGSNDPLDDWVHADDVRP